MTSLRRQNNREVELLQNTMQKQIMKSIEVQKMPSVRVRPTLHVEMKHRVMNCKLPNSSAAATTTEKPQNNHELNIDQLNEQVLKSLKNSKRSGLGGPNQ